MQVLAGDIGGTKTVLAIAEVTEVEDPRALLRVELREQRRYESRTFPGFAAICRTFAGELERPLPRLAGFGVAGPVARGRSQTTNLPWVLDEKELASALGLQSVRLANDFQALALGIPAVEPKNLVALNEGVRDPGGPWALIGAGTGLGEAVAVLGSSGRREVLATEGGHCDFAPRNELEIGILRFLSTRYRHVSWERVLSGAGLVNLAEALSHVSGEALPAQIASAIQSQPGEAPAAITASAQSGDPFCGRVVDLFCRLYGAEAGNLALKTLATGGVYVAGGIAPRLLRELSSGGFRQAFLDKGRMRSLLEAMPAEVVLDPDTTVLGAALLAAREVAQRS